MNFKIANGILIWDDGSCRSATDEEVQLQANLDATKKANAYLHECHSNWSADAIRWKNNCEALQAEVDRLKPISVKDQLPKPKQRVNVITNWDGFLPFFYINEEGDWVSETYQWRGQVTHWMPIPEVKEQAND